MGLPPSIASRRVHVRALVLAAVALIGAACSSAGGSAKSTKSTTGSTALTIPPPFEVGQQLGLGDVMVTVDSFRHDADALSVRVEVVNEATHPLSLGGPGSVSVFYDTGLHAPVRVTGLDHPLAPNGHAAGTLLFSVPARFQYPLFWVAAAPGIRPGTVVLRGAHS